ncbi:MAG: peptidase family protein [Thermoleophilia bacterium]|nr:peptidase family protein [Thermoleophilia bacterium]
MQLTAAMNANARGVHASVPPAANAEHPSVPAAGAIEVWDASSGVEQRLTGTDLARNADPVVATAIANARAVDAFFRTTFGRDGWDGQGAPMRIIVHAPNEDGTPNMNNAYWNRGQQRIFIGDGDGRVFDPLGGAFDVMVHEATHAIVDSSVHLRYSGQQGGINESWADVMGAVADPGDWLIGEDVFTPDVPGDAIRDLEHPSYTRLADLPSGPEVGPHELSALPSLAAVRVAEALGRGEMGRIWYRALVEHLDSRAGFAGAARATLDAAAELHGATSNQVGAVLDAWKSVGIDPRWKGARTDT